MLENSSRKQVGPRLWLALRFPDLPAQALGLFCDEPNPITVYEKRELIWINGAAEKAGLTCGMDITKAQLMCGYPATERNPEKELQQLNALAHRLYQFSPYIEFYSSQHVPQSGLLVEISSCLRLFGGLHSLCEKIARDLSAQQRTPVMGIGHSKASAWIFSLTENNLLTNSSLAETVEQIKTFAITLLQDFPKQVDALDKMGFITLGDIAQHIAVQTMGSFRKRFGHEFADYLADLFGIDQDFQQAALFEQPVSLFKPLEIFSEQLQFDYPLLQVDQLQKPIETLLQSLSNYLRTRQLQTQHIEWVLSDIYHNREALQIYADTPQTHWQLLLDLSLIQLENRDLPFEIDSLALRCPNTFPLQAKNHTLGFEKGARAHREAFALTAAKLKARLGASAIYKLSYKDAYLPQESNQHIALVDTCQQELPAIHGQALRPHWLLDEPVSLEVRAQGLYWRGLIRLVAGPERIQGNWWQEPSARDYFIGVRQDQQRLWVYWDLHKQQWFVQGVFS